MRVRQRTDFIRAAWAPSPLRRFVRHRAARGGVTIAAVAVFALLLASRVEALDEARAAWGQTRPVAVVVEQVAPGEPVAEAIEVRKLPRALVPATAVTEIDEWAVAKVTLYPGEVVLGDRVTGGDARELDPQTAALTVQVGAVMPLVAVGDLVDLWSVDSANFSSVRVAERVVVLAVADRTITVAVPAAQVAGATVASLRPVTVTLVG